MMHQNLLIGLLVAACLAAGYFGYQHYTGCSANVKIQHIV